MAIEFENPLTAGTVLVRSDIRSQNFVTGSAGWRIEANGNAEFNSIIIRGGTVVSGVALYYSGPPALGNLILSIAATAGTDTYGNAYQAGLTTYSSNGSINLFDEDGTWTSSDGSVIQLDVGLGAAQYFTPQTVGATVWESGKILTTLGAANRGGLNFVSPATSTNTETAAFTMFGGGPTTNDSSILFVADRFNFNGNVELPAGAQITEYDGNAFDTYVPTITNGGAVTWTTRTGWYQRVGKMIYVNVWLVVNGAGSGAGIVQVDMPTSVYRGTRQALTMHTESVGPGGSHIGNGECLFFTGGAGATADRLRTSSNGATNADANILGADLLAGGSIVIQGWYREA